MRAVARGDPLRRRVPLAGAADDLGHRAGRRPRAVRDRGARGPARRPQPAGPLHGAAQLRDRRAVAVRLVHARELRALRAGRHAGRCTSNIPEAGAFFRTRPDLDAPDIEFHFAPSMFYDEGLTAPHDHGYCFGPVVIKPTSRGRVMLRAPLPTRSRACVCNFLTTEEDRAIDDRRDAAGARDRGAGAAARRSRGAVQRPGRRLRRGDPRLGSGAPARPSTTRPRPARSARSSIRSCVSTASTACASSTRPSCRRSRARTRTRRRS